MSFRPHIDTCPVRLFTLGTGYSSYTFSCLVEEATREVPQMALT